MFFNVVKVVKRSLLVGSSRGLSGVLIIVVVKFIFIFARQNPPFHSWQGLDTEVQSKRRWSVVVIARY